MTAPVRDLQYQLNRLAGTLLDDRPGLDEQGAANVWAGTDGFSLVGALNTKNGTFAFDSILGLRGVCNALAGTTDEDPAYALSLIATP